MPLQKAVMTEGRDYFWTDAEVKALLIAWAEDKIQQELEGAKRNKVVFESISRKLLESGIRRNWKQCRAKVKNLRRPIRKQRIKIMSVVVVGQLAGFLMYLTVFLAVDLQHTHLYCWSLPPIKWMSKRRKTPLKLSKPYTVFSPGRICRAARPF